MEDAEGRMVVVCDPEPNKNYLDEVQLRSKERRYAFDVVLGKDSTNKQVFETTTQQLAEGVVQVRAGVVRLARSLRSLSTPLPLVATAQRATGESDDPSSRNGAVSSRRRLERDIYAILSDTHPRELSTLGARAIVQCAPSFPTRHRRRAHGCRKPSSWL